jgi:hypothetical protein
MMTKEDLVKAIRSNKLIGAGTCSSIDECFGDSELWESFGPPSGCNTIDEAIKKAISRENLSIDRMVDCRFGDDDDKELLIRNEWEDAKSEYYSDLHSKY